MPDIRNAFLRSFTPEQRAMLEPLQHVEFGRGEILYQQGDPISNLIFLDSGFVSNQRVTPDGIVTEAWGWGGPTGLLGTHTVLQDAESLYTYMTRIDGDGWFVRREAMHSAMAADPAFALYIQRIIRAMADDITRMLACHIAHSAEQRFARLLIMISDGIESRRIPLSRYTLGEMLAVSRKHGYLLAQNLSNERIITFDTRLLTIHRKAVLERLACPCLRGIFERRRNVVAPTA